MVAYFFEMGWAVGVRELFFDENGLVPGFDDAHEFLYLVEGCLLDFFFVQL